MSGHVRSLPAGSSLFSQQHNPTFDKGPLNLQNGAGSAGGGARPQAEANSATTSATPTARWVPASPARSSNVTATRGWRRIRSRSTSTAPQARASASGTQGGLRDDPHRGCQRLCGQGDDRRQAGDQAPMSAWRFKSHEAAIIGNTCLYGATGGKLYAAGHRRRAFRGAQLRGSWRWSRALATTVVNT